MSKLFGWKKKVTTIIYWKIGTFIFKFNKIDEKKIIFESFLGKYYSDNPKAIYKYINSNEKFSDYKSYWFLNDISKDIDGKAKKIKRLRFLYLYHIYTSKYIVVNSRMPLNFKKKKSQIYIQTWHGTPLKKLVYDMENVTLPNITKDKYLKDFSIDVDKWDYLISANDFTTTIFRKAFRYNGKIISYGYPRNDELVNYRKEDLYRIKKNLKIEKDKKIILYCPTFRDNEITEKKMYIQKINLDLKFIKEKYSDVVILIRSHYLVQKLEFVSDVFEVDNFINVSKYENINDLYLISDILITDYSSIFFDYALLNKPIILYQYDFKKYKNEIRGFYLKKEDLPFLFAYDQKELNIKIEYLYNKYLIQRNEFKYDEKFIKNYLQSEIGLVSEKVVYEILK